MTAERGSLSWQCIYGISPRGGGVDGEGWMEHPPLLSPVSLGERYSWKHPRLPAAPRPPPAPSGGGGQCVAIDRIAGAMGSRKGISVRVFTSSRGSAHPGRDTVSMGYRPVGEGLTGRGGWNIPLPCLLCLWLNGIRGNTPASLLLPGYHFQVRRTLQFMEYWKKATGLGGFEPPTFSLGG